MLIFKKDFNITEMLFTMLVCFILYSTLQAIQLPIFFRLGYTKGKLLSYLPLAVLPAAVVVASSFTGKGKVLPWLTGMLEMVMENMAITALLIAIIWIGVFLISYFISCRVYAKREF